MCVVKVWYICACSCECIPPEHVRVGVHRTTPTTSTFPSHTHTPYTCSPRQGRSGWTALIGASRYGHTAVVRELITADGSVEHIRMQDDIGYTALINAAAHGHADAVRELVATDGLAEHIRLQNNNGWNALISAARYGHTSIVRVLVAVDGSVEHLRTQDNNGATALIHAAYNGHTEIVKEIVTADGSLDLLNIKVRKEWPGGEGRACRVSVRSQVRMNERKRVPFLLLHTLTLPRRPLYVCVRQNKLGETALDWAIEEDNDECTVLLREAGAQGGSLYPEGRSERATLFVC